MSNHRSTQNGDFRSWLFGCGHPDIDNLRALREEGARLPASELRKLVAHDASCLAYEASLIRSTDPPPLHRDRE